MASIIGKPVEIRSLYRAIVRSAKAFPSVKRQKLVEEVRSEFRAHSGETDVAMLETYFQTALKGLEQLNMYSNLPSRHGDWSVDLESNPMPQPPATEEEVKQE